MEPGGGPRGAGAKRKAKKASNYYPTGPGLVAIFFQKDREGNEKDIQAVHDTFVSKLGTPSLAIRYAIKNSLTSLSH